MSARVAHCRMTLETMVVAFVDAGRRASRAMRRRDAEETDGASRARRDALDAASSLRARVAGSELCAAAASALDRCETTARDRRASVDAVVEACADVVLDFGRHRVVAAACLRRAMVATTVKICEKCARGDRDAETTTRARSGTCANCFRTARRRAKSFCVRRRWSIRCDGWWRGARPWRRRRRRRARARWRRCGEGVVDAAEL